MFKKDFVWGAATASFQIEGAAYEDGKGLSIWDTFCREPGKVKEGHTGDIACDHYHRVDEDVRLMSELGLKAYRFSVSWPRIFPKGTGEVNQKGVDFYNHLIDKLLEYGIEPYMTMYHWDLPYELHKRGGWLNPEIADWFGAYAEVLVKNYSDRVKNFITLNEPQVFIGCGYLEGSHAPGYKLGSRDLLQMGINVINAHGKAVEAIRKYAVQPAKIGVAMATCPFVPQTESEADVKAAMMCYGNADRNNFVFTDAFWLDPMVFGKLPKGIIDTCADILPENAEKIAAGLKGSIDFIGENTYQANIIKADENGFPTAGKLAVGHPKTSIDWAVYPDALYWGAKQAYERYKLPYIITESGMAAHDWVSLDGKVHDPNRIDYMHRYIKGLRRAAGEGVDVAGYFSWSFMDNFEWAKGYDERFGLVYVDYETQKRTPKDSAYWYKTVIESNGDNL